MLSDSKCVFLDAKFACLLTPWFKLPLYTYEQTRTYKHTFTTTSNNGRTSTPTVWNMQNDRTSERASEQTSQQQSSHLYAHRTFSAVQWKNDKSKYTKVKVNEWPTSIELATFECAVYDSSDKTRAPIHTYFADSRTHANPFEMCRTSHAKCTDRANRQAKRILASEREKQGDYGVKLIQFAYGCYTHIYTRPWVNEWMFTSNTRFSRSHSQIWWW